MDQQRFDQDLAQCKELLRAHQFAEALTVAQRLFEQDEENMPLHMLLATLYARCDRMLEALSHYMLLVQFDPAFEEHHCRELAVVYYNKGLTEAAAILAHGGAVKLESQPLYELALDFYTQAGNMEAAEQVRTELTA